jgi:ligand-binding SRPBCC domain-containing protein
MRLPIDIQQVFPFFCDVLNLERITPPELHFRILTHLPIEIEEGTTVDYQLRLYGVPFRWRSRITIWEPPHRFVDEQIAGPWRTWIHTHRFHEDGGGTVIDDEVRYCLPFWPLGEAALPVVRSQLARIFRYRQEATLRALVSSVPDKGNERFLG